MAIIKNRNSVKVKNRKKFLLRLLASVFSVLIMVVSYWGYQNVVVPNNKYKKAVELRNAGEYTEAIEAFIKMDGYKDSAEQIAACEQGIKEEIYSAATSYMMNNQYEEAYDKFITIKGFRDVDNLLTTNEKLKEVEANKAREEKISRFKQVGCYVMFGSYEQDDELNGKEEIEWLVLDEQRDKALLISRYGLDVKQYNEEKTSITWEECSLRKWLNNTFLCSAFSAEERKAILVTEIDNSRDQGNDKWNIYGGKNTEDRIFALSYKEASEYFKNDKDRMTIPTKYAKNQGALLSKENVQDGEETCWWWLRSPGGSEHYAAHVYDDGALVADGVNFSTLCVRPAFWIDLKSEYFLAG